MPDNKELPFMLDQNLASWVMSKVGHMQTHYESNFEGKHEEYDRIWRGIWKASDKTRDSENSKLVSPVSAQAVESSVAEVEEAIFGRGKLFDIKDNLGDENQQDAVQLREYLHEDFGNRRFRRAISECLLNASVVGTGIAEIVLAEELELAPATQQIDPNTQAIGVESKERVTCHLVPVHPRNFRIDPAASSIEDAMGCAIDRYVPTYQVELLQEAGIYMDVPVEESSWDNRLSPDQESDPSPEGHTRITKYYGLVPRNLLTEAKTPTEDVGLEEFAVDESEKVLDDGESMYVEAVVVIASGGILLKAEENPFMMRDRPVVAFQWDIVPGRFWGRGVIEKGYNTQKAIDAEMRARADALAYTTHPMLAIDATRMPRGMRPSVRPGKTILTQGNPSEVLHPFNFGQVSQITFPQQEALQRMHQMATGAVDTSGVPSVGNNEGTAAGISMSLGALIKRHKRTLVSFQEDFLIPMVKKVAYRYMQYDPERYPAKDFKFNVSSSLGIMAREYEVTQLVQLLQTMKPESPAYNVLIESIVDNMSISNREQIVEMLRQAAQPTPEQQEQAQAKFEAEMQFQNSQISALEGQAAESNARAFKYQSEAEAIPKELAISEIEAITRNLAAGTQDDKAFEQRLKAADRALKERDLDLKEATVRGNLAKTAVESIRGTGGRQQEIKRDNTTANGDSTGSNQR